VGLGVSEVREVAGRACARQDVLDACARRDLGAVVGILGALGVSQGKIAELTGISQGRLSEWVRGRRVPRASSTFEAFAGGLGLPAAAREALGLAAWPSGDAGPGLAGPGQVPGLDAALEYPDTVVQAAGNVSALWLADLAAPGAAGRGPVVPAAWGTAAARWLAGPAGGPGAGEAAGGVRVGIADVERFRATIEVFRQLDDRFGGGHARAALVQYLRGDGERLLRGRYPDAVGGVLLSAVAEAVLLAAWMTYDSMPYSPQAQRYFIQALGLAQASGDRLLGAAILDAMSHQATYTGRFTEAAGLAQAARAGTSRIATASLTAHFHTMEARALARVGDVKGGNRALALAVTQYERRRPGDDPAWFQYFDEAELSAEFGHCLRDLGRAKDAARYAGRSVQVAVDGAFARSDFFAAMVLADSYLAAGEAEQACRTALAALAAGEQLRSGRSVYYLREFREHLLPAADTAAVRDFTEQAAGSRLWRIAARPQQSLAVA
jgi:transcriptional regulator with XRE-family HTH domain